MDMTTLSADQLRLAASIKEEIEALTAQLTSILSGSAPANSGVRTQNSETSRAPGRRPMSAAGKARIAAAAKARWAKIRAQKGGSAPAASASGSQPASVVPKQRKFSAAARARIAASAKARWAKAKAAGKSHL